MKRDFFLVGKDNCLYCDMAQNLLAIRNEEFHYMKYTDLAEGMLEMYIIETGHKTFPFIWVNEFTQEDIFEERFIGGFDKLKEYLNKNDE